jgi:hypothetical protein
MSQIPYFFVTIPKTATNAVSDFVSFNNMLYHTYAQTIIKKNIFDVKWNSLYTFTFVRNPIDMIISWYNYHKQSPREKPWVREYYKEDFKLWCKNGFKTHWEIESFTKLNNHWNYKDSPLDQYKYVFDKNMHCLVTKVFKYEKINEDIEILRKDLQISSKKQLQQINKSNGDIIRRSLDEETNQLIKKRFYKDFELFEYK